jgi:hypothetical protein
MKEIILCDICNIQMKLTHKRTVKGKRGNFRMRQFTCPLCGFYKTIAKEGYRDLIAEPLGVIEQINKNYKQEEENRNG